MNGGQSMGIIKIIVLPLIITICTILGIKKSKNYENREYILREAITLFKGIENEIKYMLMPLPNAIEITRQNLRTSLKDVMGAVSTKLLDENLEDGQIANEMDKLIELTPYDKQILIQGITNLGQSDVEGQVGVIKLTVNTLENRLEEAIEDKKKNSKLYKTVGFLTGLMIAVIFI